MYNNDMDLKLEEYLSLNKLFSDRGYSLYLVGGTVRDYLMGLPLDDMDAVTDATPDEMKEFLPNAIYTFAKYGSVIVHTQKKVKFDITTLRKENGYLDSRHPGNIEFVKDLKIDVKRRDFTLNSLYLDKDLKVIDYVDGVEDLHNKLLRMVGDPEIRLKEDPLRIIRALRFSAQYGLAIDSELSKAIRNNIGLLNNLNIDKVKQDIRKLKKEFFPVLKQLFEDYDIKHLLDVVN